MKDTVKSALKMLSVKVGDSFWQGQYARRGNRRATSRLRGNDGYDGKDTRHDSDDYWRKMHRMNKQATKAVVTEMVERGVVEPQEILAAPDSLAYLEVSLAEARGYWFEAVASIAPVDIIGEDGLPDYQAAAEAFVLVATDNGLEVSPEDVLGDDPDDLDELVSAAAKLLSRRAQAVKRRHESWTGNAGLGLDLLAEDLSEARRGRPPAILGILKRMKSDSLTLSIRSTYMDLTTLIGREEVTFAWFKKLADDISDVEMDTYLQLTGESAEDREEDPPLEERVGLSTKREIRDALKRLGDDCLTLSTPKNRGLLRGVVSGSLLSNLAGTAKKLHHLSGLVGKSDSRSAR